LIQIVQSFYFIYRDSHNPDESLFPQQIGNFILRGGNFHGEYPAKALDFLAVGITELASNSENFFL